VSKPATKTEIRRAAKDYNCSDKSYHTIKKGELYLFSKIPPWSEVADGKWRWHRSCLQCSEAVQPSH
jgi:hypothetical protein